MQQSESGAMAEMPQYQSHKQVWALKIKDIQFDCEKRGPNEETDGTATIFPVEEGFAPIKVGHDFVCRHLDVRNKENIVGGYYVVYGDGYASWSPAKAFEEGYKRI